jgi:hypothetical protein
MFTDLLKEIVDTSLSILLGAVVALGTSILTDHRARKRQQEMEQRAQQRLQETEQRAREYQERANRHRVRGLLYLASTHASQAADHGVRTSLEPLTTIFGGEGLYATLEKNGWVDVARELWIKAENHNTGLHRSGGAQRVQELKSAIEQMVAALGEGE